MMKKRIASSRRAFFLNAARVGVLGSIVALGTVLLSRVKLASAAQCERKSVCVICSDVFTCEKPIARKTAKTISSTLKAKRGVKR